MTAQAQPAEGEEFYAWMQNGKIVSTDADYTFTAVSDVTLTAVFDPIYTVSFDSDGGTPVESQLVIRGDTASNPGAPVRTGLYTFVGWYLDDTLYDFSSPVMSDLTLVAKWKLTSGAERFDHPGSDPCYEDADDQQVPVHGCVQERLVL